MELLIIMLIILFATVIYIISTYNKFIRFRNQTKEANGAVDVYLKQRFDLVPNLVECVKGIKNFEEKLLVEITELRNSFNTAANESEKIAINGKLNNNIKFIVEAYPVIKSSENFLQLQQTLVKLEDQLQAARRFYNSTVTEYNILVTSFPSNLIAGMFNFGYVSLLNFNESEKANIDIKI